MFVCHGNICRSPMAEYVMKQLVANAQQTSNFEITSAATSQDEISVSGLGNPMDPRAMAQLSEFDVPFKSHHAVQLTKADYDQYDWLICMDEANFLDMNCITGGDPAHKEYKLLAFTGNPQDIEDPWYTGDFKTALLAIKRGCEVFYQYLLAHADSGKEQDGHI